MKNPIVSIVIPFYNKWELTHARLMDIYKFAPDDCEIILVDDASTDESCRHGIAWWQHSDFIRHPIRYFRNKENLGFGGSLNNGAKLANGKILILLSNDVLIHGNFVSDIVTLIGEDNTMLVGGRVVDWKGGWNEFDLFGKHLVVPYAEGWLLACTLEAWKTLGGFDLRYGKYDYEDIDLSTRALDLNFHLVGLNSPHLQHLFGQTIASLKVNRLESTNTNRSIYMEKWSSSLVDIMERTYGLRKGS